MLSPKIKTCFIKGTTIRELIYHKIGVLVYEGKELTFINGVSLKGRKAMVCPDANQEKVVFLSNDFDLIKLLPKEGFYKIEFGDNFIEFMNVNGETQLVIRGIRLCG